MSVNATNNVQYANKSSNLTNLMKKKTDLENKIQDLNKESIMVANQRAGIKEATDNIQKGNTDPVQNSQQNLDKEIEKAQAELNVVKEQLQNTNNTADAPINNQGPKLGLDG